MCRPPQLALDLLDRTTATRWPIPIRFDNAELPSAYIPGLYAYHRAQLHHLSILIVPPIMITCPTAHSLTRFM